MSFGDRLKDDDLRDTVARAVRPQRNGDEPLYRYRLYTPDGDEPGEAHYAVRIQPDEIIWTGDGRKLRGRDGRSIVLRLRSGGIVSPSDRRLRKERR
jgi:hypothetical protein